jgi:hypothetical protein
MKTYALCPISDKKINERIARVNAIITVFLLLTFIITNNIIAIVFLAIDFFLRASGFSKYSLIAIASKAIIRWLQIKDRFINAGPKIFAARIGLVLTGLTILSLLLSFSSLSFAIAGILGLFSFLEGVFGFCVACQIYPVLYKVLYTENLKAYK